MDIRRLLIPSQIDDVDLSEDKQCSDCDSDASSNAVAVVVQHSSLDCSRIDGSDSQQSDSEDDVADEEISGAAPRTSNALDSRAVHHSSCTLNLYGASVRTGVRPKAAYSGCVRAEKTRKSHPTFDEWRAEKLSVDSLRQTFFGLDHSCTNLVNGRPCHVNLWGDVDSGIKAMRQQRAPPHAQHRLSEKQRFCAHVR